MGDAEEVLSDSRPHQPGSGDVAQWHPFTGSAMRYVPVLAPVQVSSDIVTGGASWTQSVPSAESLKLKKKTVIMAAFTPTVELRTLDRTQWHTWTQ